MSSMTTSYVRQKNKQAILKYIYNEKCTCQQLICETLGISRPTVIPILREYAEEGLIIKDGFFDSTGGRKANALVFVANSKVALGVELLIDAYKITAVDLYGETIASIHIQAPFENSEDYYHIVCDSIKQFISENNIASDKILGIGIVLQGLISSDGTYVTYGKILNCTGLTIDSFTKQLSYPCKFFHDAEAAAQDELWQNPALQNAIYMNIRSHVSGAVIVNRDFLQGTELKSGVFEHMSLVPSGRSCYCGRKGCVETYCSTQALLDMEGSLDTFFKKLRNDDKKCKDYWIKYLNYLATSINNLRMFIDYPIIIGGTLAPYLQESDIRLLHQMIYDNTAFPTDSEFIHASQCTDFTISRGAALPYVKKFLFSVMEI
ncbi:ROK family protein [Bariatricus sp. SGI.161]|uniref:ROK family protein n=1 Tax=Bariatricus sp. SGI.161 TaxID=3420550 RepID=UPI003D03F02B|nr:ROK family protein [bacterium]